MDKDSDNRVLAQGTYRDALNILVTNSEQDDSGTVQKSLSNKRLTNINFGANPECIGTYADEFRDKLYAWVVSDTGSFLYEWDNPSQSASIVLQDTRALIDRVFNLKRGNFVTGIGKIQSEDINNELLLWTDDNMQPCCINIERAKLYGANNFTEEAILLIKKPPRFEPEVQLTFTGGLENFIKEEFLTFTYRYKYLDGEYSAFSGFTTYNFAPGEFNLDYLTVENLGMVNNFNALRILFNTGESQVTDIQLIVKKSNSNVPYIIETFNKLAEGWSDDQEQSFIFSNNKTLVPLPESELFRLYDNVPLKAKAGTLIGNKWILGNYVEGYNLINSFGQKVKMDYTLDIISNDVSGELIPFTYGVGPVPPPIVIDFSSVELKEGSRITFYFNQAGVYYIIPGFPIIRGSFAGTFPFILNDDYDTIEDLVASPDFVSFLVGLNNAFTAGYLVTPPDGATLTSSTPYIFSATGNVLTITGPTLTYTLPDTSTEEYRWGFFEDSTIRYSEFAVTSSVKTNRSYEIGIIYLDKYDRSTTVLTSATNTIYVPQTLSIFQNKIKVTLNHLPPTFADRYKIVVKQKTLDYYTVYAVLFYEDGPYRWVRLDGANKDKVKKDDILVLKADLSGPRSDVFEVAVIDIISQPSNFISGNVDVDDNEIIEESGLYMKIKSSNINMETTGETFFTYNGPTIPSISDAPSTVGPVVSTLDTTSGNYVDIPILAGSRINISITLTDNDNRYNIEPLSFNQSFISQNEYTSFENWFNTEFPGLGAMDSYVNLTVSRDANNGIILSALKDPFFFGKITLNLTVQLTEALVIFETQPIVADIDIFYETGETFEIIDGFHQADLQNQTSVLPAIIESDFFNCYVFGNGAESYRVKDLINKNYLNIDLKPTAASIEEYKEIRRYADLTYSEAYIESSGINGLNEYNLSLANYKELDKAGGFIQILHSRERDVVVLQEEQASKVLFDKNAIYTALGNPAITSTPGVLGEQILYKGNYGISRNPESFAADDMGRLYYSNVKKGVVLRLSLDGVERIIYGMKDYFRDLFRTNMNAAIKGGVDPYHGTYNITIGEEPEQRPLFQCGSQQIKSNISVVYSYELRLNDLGGDVVIQYNITGNVTIQAVFNGTTYVASNVTGSGSLSFERDSLVENIVVITVTPISSLVSYTLTNICPTGTALKIIHIVLNDSTDLGLTMQNRYRWGGSAFYTTNDEFDAIPISRFQTFDGIEGTGQFPSNGSLVTIQAFKDSINSGRFSLDECNRLGYLVTDTLYTEADINTILGLATFPTVTVSSGESTETAGTSFVFSRTDPDEILYMLWDYTERKPEVNDDSASVSQGGSVIIDVLANDPVSPAAVVSIVTTPINGIVTVNLDKTITYQHNGSEVFDDSFIYRVTDGGCFADATVFITVGVSCSEGISASGSTGIYTMLINVGTDIGYTGIIFNSFGIPDRAQIYYDDILVVDSLYTGDSLAAGPPVSYPGLLGPHLALPVFEYDGAAFVATGDTEDIDVIQADIVDNTTTPINGNRTLLFNKTTTTPTVIRVVVTGPVDSTAWDIDGVCPVAEEDLVAGEDKFVWGFFNLANQDSNTTSMGLFLGTSPVKFYTNALGDTNFTQLGWSATNKYINDGVTHWELDINGNILSSGPV